MWYRYKDEIINLLIINYIKKIHVDDYGRDHSILLYSNEKEEFILEYFNKEERDAEFEKICKMLGFKEEKDVV